MWKKLCIVSLLFLASTSQASDLSIGLSNKALSVDYTSSTANKEGLEFTAGVLHNVDNGNVFNVGAQVSSQINPSTKAALGGKVIAVFNDVKDATGLALGGQFQMALLNSPKIQFGAHAWYAPDVTTTSGAKNFKDYGASLGYQVMSNGEVFVAYRYVRMDYNTRGNLKIEEGPLVGLKMSF
jgi:hypothetical protein